MKKMINFAERYTDYWINYMEKPKTYFFNEEEIEKYVRMFPQGTKVMMEQVELDCKGHTYRQIMGLDELDCGVYHEFLEKPRIAFLRSCLSEMANGLRSLFHKLCKQP